MLNSSGAKAKYGIFSLINVFTTICVSLCGKYETIAIILDEYVEHLHVLQLDVLLLYVI